MTAFKFLPKFELPWCSRPFISAKNDWRSPIRHNYNIESRWCAIMRKASAAVGTWMVNASNQLTKGVNVFWISDERFWYDRNDDLDELEHGEILVMGWMLSSVFSEWEILFTVHGYRNLQPFWHCVNIKRPSLREEMQVWIKWTELPPRRWDGTERWVTSDRLMFT